jgi:hypothetical protein
MPVKDRQDLGAKSRSPRAAAAAALERRRTGSCRRRTREADQLSKVAGRWADGGVPPAALLWRRPRRHCLRGRRRAVRSGPMRYDTVTNPDVFDARFDG